MPRRFAPRLILTISQKVKIGGDDVPKLEPKRLDPRKVDKVVRHLRRIYKENPALFDIPTFAQKQY